MVSGTVSPGPWTIWCSDFDDDAIACQDRAASVKVSLASEEGPNVVKGLQIVQEILTVGRRRTWCWELIASREVKAMAASWRMIKEPSK